MLIVSLVFPVLAVDSYGNEFVILDDYAEYYFPDSDLEPEVYVDARFPADWFTTEVSGENWTGGLGTFYGSTFTYEPMGDIQSYRIRPLGGNMQNGERVGDQIKKAHFVDLTAIPDSSWFNTNFAIHANIENAVSTWQEPTAYAYLFFVDSSGKVVYKWYDYIKPSKVSDGNGSSGIIHSWYYNISTNLEELAIPDSAVGFVPLFTLKNLGLDCETITIEFDPMRITYNLSALQYQAQQNEKLQNSLVRVENALEEQNKAFDDFVNADIGGTTPEGQDKLDGLDDLEQEIIDKTQDGRDEFNNVINDAETAINSNFQTFMYLVGVFRVLSEGTWIRAIISISLALGICGFVLNIVSVSIARSARNSDNSNNKRKG